MTRDHMPMKAELLLITGDERAFGYLFQKISHYPELAYKIEEDKIILFGESKNLMYVVELLVKQLARRFDNTKLFVCSFGFGLFSLKTTKL